MRPGGRFESIQDWASKAPGAAARIAGAMHIIEHADEDPTKYPVSEEIMIRTEKIIDYLCEHALAAFAFMGTDNVDVLAKKIVEWIKRNDKKSFSQRDLNQAYRSQTPEIILQALQRLLNSGYLNRLPALKSEGAGRKPSPRWEVNHDFV